MTFNVAIKVIAGCWLLTLLMCLPMLGSAYETKHIGKRFLLHCGAITVIALGIIYS